jgi:ubiquinone/menaquinone biosynthesis C-methylase UbiE
MTQVTDAAEVDRALKAKHRAIWAMGDYPAVARELVAPLGPILVEAAGVGPGDSVLDIAAGSGNASLPAALTGAEVIASDLTPALLETGRQRAAEAGATIDWVEADAEALPFADGEFDAVISAIGIMFAPHHQAAADELVRVCRPGGSIGLISWTPGGFIGEMFVTMRPYAPPPPPGAQPAPLWGGEDHVRELLGDRVTDVDARVQTLVVDHFAQPEEFREYFKRNYGPTIALYRSLADDPERAAALDRDLDDLARRYGIGDGNARMEWEYLLLTARKRG